MRPAGLLYVLEFKKVDGPPGPPRKIRLSREELNSMTEPFGFVEVKSLDTGPVTYLSVFRIDKTSLAPVLTSPGR